MGRYPHLGAFEVEGPADFAVAREALAATGHARARRIAPFSTRSAAARSSASSSPRRWRRSAAQRPQDGILLLDEPTAALDLGYQLERRRRCCAISSRARP